ncbi:hypothetical protein D0Y65_050186, partial [Glycine soja]
MRADQIPSVKFNNADRVILLNFLLPSSPHFLTELLCSSSSVSISSSSSFFLWPVRSREQSMSSITTIDLLDVSTNNLLSLVFFFTVVSSRSY